MAESNVTVTAPAWDVGSADNVYAIAESQVSNLALARIGADLIKTTLEDTPSARQCRAIFGPTRDEMLRDYDFNFATRRIMFARNTTAETLGAWAYCYDIPNASAFNVLKVVDIAANASNLYEVYNRQINCDLVSDSAGADITAATMALVTGIVTVSSVADLFEGRPVMMTAGTIPTGISLNTVYWVRDLTATTFKLAATPGGTALVGTVTPGSGITISPLAYLDTKVVLSIVDTSTWDTLFKDAFVLRMASKLAIPLVKRADLAQFLQSEFAAIFSLAKSASKQEQPTDESDVLWTDRTSKVAG
jgi:hypothetical protein